MKLIILLTSFFYFVHSNAQIEEKTISDLVKTIDLIDYKPAKFFKILTQLEFKKFLYAEVSDRILQQLNIDGYFLCENDKRKGFDAYNLYYDKISWELYSSNRKEINMLLELDGVIKQSK